ncbi:HNH endonuclease [Cereibacter sphaeroides]|uniref:HNH endonuclease signature motif containing protein n=1 Tax=Cereibacter sphaeroides TaxID=1063 RepID=UPI001F3CCA42|nr:HNH endonuclease signature motif containing protein [Cereibacter sphaeroides]MCE6960579.1 HNH endonuclease [Cereibacter sphaeroides]MCE6972740.1 HNH endonuclease [Cereibacter sphaeroides]
MPLKPPRICGCGRKIAAGLRCACQAKADAERKARFDRTRPNSSQRGYSGAWEKARKEFLKEHPFCRRCGAPAAVVDHITPHKGNASLFWDRKNWQALCVNHHSSAKQSEERRAAQGQQQ